ncbi:hypothetical protein ACXX84_01590 [Mycoplasma sp. AC157]
MFINIPAPVQKTEIKTNFSKNEINFFDFLISNKNNELLKESQYKSKIFKIRVLKQIKLIDDASVHQLTQVFGQTNALMLKKTIKDIKENSIMYKKFQKEVSHLLNVGQSRSVIEGEVLDKVEELKKSYESFLKTEKEHSQALKYTTIGFTLGFFTIPGAIVTASVRAYVDSQIKKYEEFLDRLAKITYKDLENGDNSTNSQDRDVLAQLVQLSEDSDYNYYKTFFKNKLDEKFISDNSNYDYRY